MNLDDLARFRELDTQNIIAHIDALPEQLQQAWTWATERTASLTVPQIQQIRFEGNGTFATAADLVTHTMLVNRPCLVQRAQAYQSTAQTLSISQRPGSDAIQCVFSLGGADVAVWPLPALPDRCLLGTYMGFFLAMFSRLGVIADPSQPIQDAVRTLQTRREIFNTASPVVKNPAKRLGGQMIGRVPTIFGAGLMAPVARRWKTQINENAKSWATFEVVPEAIFGAANGVMHPPPLMTRVHCTFLMPAPFEPAEMTDQINLIHDLFLQEGIAVDKVKGRGDNALTQALSAVQYGDYVSYYLAMAYEVDPMPTPINM